MAAGCVAGGEAPCFSQFLLRGKLTLFPLTIEMQILEL